METNSFMQLILTKLESDLQLQDATFSKLHLDPRIFDLHDSKSIVKGM